MPAEMVSEEPAERYEVDFVGRLRVSCSIEHQHGHHQPGIGEIRI